MNEWEDTLLSSVKQPICKFLWYQIPSSLIMWDFRMDFYFSQNTHNKEISFPFRGGTKTDNTFNNNTSNPDHHLYSRGLFLSSSCERIRIMISHVRYYVEGIIKRYPEGIGYSATFICSGSWFDIKRRIEKKNSSTHIKCPSPQFKNTNSQVATESTE